MLEFEIRREGKVAVVTPSGDVLASSMAELRPAMRDLVRSGIGEMVVDLAATSMIDSTGLGLLLSAFNSISKAGGKFSIVHASDEIRIAAKHAHAPAFQRFGTVRNGDEPHRRRRSSRIPGGVPRASERDRDRSAGHRAGWRRNRRAARK